MSGFLLSVLCLFDALSVVTAVGIDPDDVPFIDEHRNIDGRSGFEGDDLRGVAGSVSFDRRCGLSHLEFDLDRIAKTDDVVIESRCLNDRVRLDEFNARPDMVVVERESICSIFRIAEPEFTLVGVEILHLFGAHICFFCFLELVEDDFFHVSGQEILDLGVIDRARLLLLEDMRVQDFIRLVVNEDDLAGKDFIVV